VSRGDPQPLRDAQRAFRERLDELSSIARHELELSGATAPRVAQTLRAASVEKEASKSLLAGTLTGDVEQAGFGPLLSAVPSRPRKTTARAKAKPAPKARPKAKPKPPPKPKPDPRVRQRARIQEQLDRARARVRELEARLEDLGGP
jgi:outer membrane biosynthesis protein TonB